MKYRLSFITDGAIATECDCTFKNEQEMYLLSSLFESMTKVYNLFVGRSKVSFSFTLISGEE